MDTKEPKPTDANTNTNTTPDNPVDTTVVNTPVDATPEKIVDPTVDTPAETTPQVELVDSEPIETVMEATPAPITGASVKSKSNKYTIITVIIVALALLIVLFQLEKQDRIGTNVFGGVITTMEANAPIAVVNGIELQVEDLATGTQQLEQAAAAQGLDLADPTVRAEIEAQAIEMLVNTTLLEQAAVANGVVVEEEAVTARITELEESAGGKEALAARLAEFSIDEAQLYKDVSDELTIRALLDVIFADAQVVASEEEITAVYQDAVAANDPGVVPPLEEVRAQIATQLVQTKEQAALDTYLQELRADANIELN
jgi:FKBP-type peptidyl-prolyl cis-trans isomerase (trigger factor)